MWKELFENDFAAISIALFTTRNQRRQSSCIHVKKLYLCNVLCIILLPLSIINC